MEPKSTGRISPFDGYPHDVGNTYLMLHKAIELLQKVWLQSPHWEQEPTKKQLDTERRLEEESEDAALEIERLAGEITRSLTGKFCTILSKEEMDFLCALLDNQSLMRKEPTLDAHLDRVDLNGLHYKFKKLARKMENRDV